VEEAAASEASDRAASVEAAAPGVGAAAAPEAAVWVVDAGVVEDFDQTTRLRGRRADPTM
jgi:hypothetical protein